MNYKEYQEKCNFFVTTFIFTLAIMGICKVAKGGGIMNKRMISLVLGLLIILGTASNIHAFTGNSKVDWLIEKGYVQGDSRGYRLQDNITRAEATKMIVQSSGLSDWVEGYQGFKSMFSDMNVKHWANGYVNVAVINSLVNGYPDKTFKPSNNITYSEVVKMLVIANGDLPDTDGYTGSYWFIPYIIKADEIGITAGINISDYTKDAVREKIFELVYNTISLKKTSKLEKYKGIVVENERVGRLNKYEVSLVVFEGIEDKSSGIMKYNNNDKIKITVPKDIEDVEYLLGKVIEVTIDGNDKATNIKVDSSYSYMEGPILAGEYDVYLGANGRYYDVYLEDRYDKSSDRIYGAYHNDRDYNYEDYLHRLGNYDSNGEITFLAEFAKVTVKNRMVYFIDSYTFSDIAPVSQVGRSGEIYIYKDDNAGRSTNITIDSAIGYTYNYEFEVIDIGDIKVGDVLHIYNKYSAIVRQDAKDYGEYEDIIEDAGFYYGLIENREFQIRESNARRPIYSLNGRDFDTLYADTAYEDLYDLLFKEVVFLLDINNHIQSIVGNIK